MKKIRIALIGVGGFAGTHLENISIMEKAGDVELCCFSEINIEAQKNVIEDLKSKGKSFYLDYKQMLTEEKDIDIVVIPSPIYLHKPMCIDALSAGYNVMLEKPPCVTIQDYKEMMEAVEKSNKICSVNFQNLYSESLRELNKKICSGELGKVKSLTAVGMYKRDSGYYSRAGWAGKLVYNNNYVLDGTINNPFAHLMNASLFLASDIENESALPIEVTAELYRANDIESEDTSCVHIKTSDGVDVYFYATLCEATEMRPYIKVDCEKAEAIWSYDNKFEINYPNGKKEEYKYKQKNLMIKHYNSVIKNIECRSSELPSSLRQMEGFVLASNGAFESAEYVRKIGEEYIDIIEEVNKGKAVVFKQIKGIKDIMYEASEKKKLYSEAGVSWAGKTKKISLEGYSYFKRFK
jgi:predicted dehydrogenase